MPSEVWFVEILETGASLLPYCAISHLNIHALDSLGHQFPSSLCAACSLLPWSGDQTNQRENRQWDIWQHIARFFWTVERDVEVRVKDKSGGKIPKGNTITTVAINQTIKYSVNWHNYQLSEILNGKYMSYNYSYISSDPPMLYFRLETIDRTPAAEVLAAELAS
jgi:hypothetical protein